MALRKMEEKMKKTLITLLMILISVAALSAGGKQEASVEPGEVQSLVQVNLQDGDPGTYDPFSTFTSTRCTALMQVYERLAVLNKDGSDYINVLAEDIQKDGEVYTVVLRDNIYDTEGNHLTADDVIFCIDKVKALGSNPSVSYVASTNKIDDYTLEIMLENNSLGLWENVVTALYICTKASYEASSDAMKTHPVGTGPYKFSSLESGSSVTMVKNEGYWARGQEAAGEQMANVDTIVFKVVTEASQMVVSLESGTLDMSFIDFSSASRFLEGGELHDSFLITITDTWGGNDIYLNMSDKSVFKDNINLRKAILYGINREDIINAAFDGYAKNPVTFGQGRYLDSNPKWANEDYFDYDLEKAKQYLAASGYKPGELELRLLFPFQSYTNNAAQVIQANLSKVGVNVELLGLDAQIANDYSKDATRFDMVFNGKGGPGYISSQIWNARLNAKINSPDGSYAFGFISDPHLQELLEASVDVETHSRESVDAVHYYLKDQAYMMRMYVEQKCVVSNNSIVTDCYLNSDSRLVPGASTYVWN